MYFFFFFFLPRDFWQESISNENVETVAPMQNLIPLPLLSKFISSNENNLILLLLLINIILIIVICIMYNKINKINSKYNYKYNKVQAYIDSDINQ